jgi:hypothetical protein
LTVHGPPADVSATDPVPVSKEVMFAVRLASPLGGLPPSFTFA